MSDWLSVYSDVASKTLLLLLIKRCCYCRNTGRGESHPLLRLLVYRIRTDAWMFYPGCCYCAFHKELDLFF